MTQEEMKKLLEEAWKEVFQVEEVSDDADFFEAGGDSIMAVQLSAWLVQKGVKLDLADIFTASAFGEIAEKLVETEPVFIPEAMLTKDIAAKEMGFPSVEAAEEAEKNGSFSLGAEAQQQQVCTPSENQKTEETKDSEADTAKEETKEEQKAGGPQGFGPMGMPGMPPMFGPMGMPGVPPMFGPMGMPGVPPMPAPMGMPGMPPMPAPMGMPGMPPMPAPMGMPGMPPMFAPMGMPGAPQAWLVVSLPQMNPMSLVGLMQGWNPMMFMPQGGNPAGDQQTGAQTGSAPVPPTPPQLQKYLSHPMEKPAENPNVVKIDKAKVAQRTQTPEEALMQVMKGILPNFDKDEDFFAQGLTSFDTVKMVTRCGEAGYQLELKDIYMYSTFDELVQHLK